MPKRDGTQELLTAPLSVAMTGTERGRVRRAAFLSGGSVSAFIRAASVKAAARVLADEDRDAKAA